MPTSAYELLGITADQVRAYMEVSNCSIFEAKRKLVQIKLRELVNDVDDPKVKLILQVLVESIR